MRWTEKAGLLVVAAIVCSTPLSADVRTEQKTKLTLGGGLGRVVSMFGGKAAKEGVVQTVTVKGDRKLTVMENMGQLVDLAEEKIYDIDFKRRSYKVTTFAELRQKMQEAQEKAQKEMAKQKEKEKDEPAESGPRMEIDVTSKETGERKKVNGFDARRVITTVTVREEGKTLEEGGGLVLTSDSWLTGDAPAIKEIEEFDRRYFEKIAAPVGGAEGMAAALAMYPALKDALSRARVEGAKLEGTPVSTVLTVDAVKSAAQAEQEAKAEEGSGGGGLGGMLARRLARRKKDENADNTRAMIMTTTSDVLSVTTSVAADAVAIPADFKQKD